jgi:hypothetical protein
MKMLTPAVSEPFVQEANEPHMYGNEAFKYRLIRTMKPVYMRKHAKECGLIGAVTVESLPIPKLRIESC